MFHSSEHCMEARVHFCNIYWLLWPSKSPNRCHWCTILFLTITATHALTSLMTSAVRTVVRQWSFVYDTSCFKPFYWTVPLHTVNVFRPGLSQQNAPWIWSRPLLDCRLSTGYILLTAYLLTELSHSREAANCAATQELPSILRNLKVHHRVHKSPPLVPILSQIDLVHTIPSLYDLF
jgi:hypothetical protein